MGNQLKKLTPELLQEIGGAFVTMLGVQQNMGHSRPSSTADDYIPFDEDGSEAHNLVRDAFALCVQSAREREAESVREFVEEYQVGQIVARMAMWE